MKADKAYCSESEHMKEHYMTEVKKKERKKVLPFCKLFVKVFREGNHRFLNTDKRNEKKFGNGDV